MCLVGSSGRSEVIVDNNVRLNNFLKRKILNKIRNLETKFGFLIFGDVENVAIQLLC